jgi:hypothetical protein
MDLERNPEQLEQLFEPYQQEGSFCAVEFDMGTDEETNYLLSVRIWDQLDHIPIVMQYLVRMFHDDNSIDLQLDATNLYTLEGAHTLHDVWGQLSHVHPWWSTPLTQPIPFIQHQHQHQRHAAPALGAGTKCEHCKQLFADGEGDYDDDGSFYCNPCWEQPKDGSPTPPTSPTKKDNTIIRSPSPASTNNVGGGGGGAYPTWLHGAITKEQAEELVMQAGGNGTFMVWERKPEANEYVSIGFALST